MSWLTNKFLERRLEGRDVRDVKNSEKINCRKEIRLIHVKFFQETVDLYAKDYSRNTNSLYALNQYSLQHQYRWTKKVKGTAGNLIDQIIDENNEYNDCKNIPKRSIDSFCHNVLKLPLLFS
ncbi:hypothetical protein RIR_jg32684.t2 [Rhizophagus irregularis DAOM 181602=DAOM 197198]|nr:hypothetical protein RIR_jg32684.t2 [Rhizophagus irregularis DAOM 181602=DAOM 197198]